MLRSLAGGLGLLPIVIGGIFLGQGVGLIGGSFMTGRGRWAVTGVVMIAFASACSPRPGVLRPVVVHAPPPIDGAAPLGRTRSRSQNQEEKRCGEPTHEDTAVPSRRSFGDDRKACQMDAGIVGTVMPVLENVAWTGRALDRPKPMRTQRLTYVTVNCNTCRNNGSNPPLACPDGIRE